MTELICEIKEITNIGENEYFLVYSTLKNKSYIIPTYQLIKYNVQIGETHTFKLEQNLNSKQFFLNYVKSNDAISADVIVPNDYYICGNVYEFKIVDFHTKLNKKNEPVLIITVEDISGNLITVLALKWQKSEIWKFETLKCEVERISGKGLPIIINKDFRHPFYEIEKEYKFDVIGEKIKENINGTFNVFILKGEDECLHEVIMLPNQKNFNNEIKTLLSD